MSATGDLIKSTGELYQRAIRDGLVALGTHWFWVLAPVLYLGLLMLVSPVLPIFGPYGAQFALGILQSLFLSHYLVGVKGAVSGERISLAEQLPRTWEMFFAIINSLFLLFILSFLMTTIVKAAPSLMWIHAAANLIILLLLNPLLEIAVFQGESGTAGATTSVEFVRDNFIEWFLPQLIVIAPVVVLFGWGALGFFSSGDPATLPQMITTIAGIWTMNGEVSSFIALAFAFAFTFVAMVFRGSLFRQLSRSSRRKRVYQQKFGR